MEIEINIIVSSKNPEGLFFSIKRESDLIDRTRTNLSAFDTWSKQEKAPMGKKAKEPRKKLQVDKYVLDCLTLYSW